MGTTSWTQRSTFRTSCSFLESFNPSLVLLIRPYPSLYTTPSIQVSPPLSHTCLSPGPHAPRSAPRALRAASLPARPGPLGPASNHFARPDSDSPQRAPACTPCHAPCRAHSGRPHHAPDAPPACSTAPAHLISSPRPHTGRPRRHIRHRLGLIAACSSTYAPHRTATPHGTTTVLSHLSTQAGSDAAHGSDANMCTSLEARPRRRDPPERCPRASGSTSPAAHDSD